MQQEQQPSKIITSVSNRENERNLNREIEIENEESGKFLTRRNSTEKYKYFIELKEDRERKMKS